MKITPFLFAGIILALVSCNNQPDEKPVIREEQEPEFTTISFDTLGYSAEVRSGMKKTTGLNDDAFMQYVDSSANEFIIGISEPKEETQYVLEAAEIWDDKISFMENYQSLTQSQFQESMTFGSTPVWKKETINGISIETAQFRAKHPEVPGELSYTAIYFEDQTNIYIIYYWSMIYKEKDYLQNVSRFIKSIRKNGNA